MKTVTVDRYMQQADARERDPIVTPGEHGRADVASGKRGRWGRYNDPASLVWADNIFGESHGLTRNQANVYGAAKEIAGTGTRVTMRALGVSLGVAPSTVLRAVVRLTALGFLAYQSNRGRLGGTVFLLRVARDGLEWCREDARARLRKWWKAAEARIARLRANVASSHPGREQELYQYRTVAVTGLTATFSPWTPDDFREAGLM